MGSKRYIVYKLDSSSIWSKVSSCSTEMKKEASRYKSPENVNDVIEYELVETGRRYVKEDGKWGLYVE